jgi:imidazolonepropionase-like amidohydrolase
MQRLLAAVALTSALAAQESLALVGATVHSGDGAAPIPNAVVLIREGVITAVGPREKLEIPASARVVELAGKHLTPGLIDTHVHYSQTGWVDGRPDAVDRRKEYPYEQAMADNQAHPERFHLAFLHSGVTAVFDVGGYPWTRLLGKQTERDPKAPHVAATGALLATYDPKVLQLPDAKQFVFPATADEARAAVRAHKEAGSDAIKLWYLETPGHGVAEWTEMVHATGDEAKKLGLPLFVHATTLATARDAVDAGAHLLVHSVEDRIVDDAFVAAMKQKGTSYCPTLTVYDGYLQVYAGEPSAEVLAQLESVHPSVKDRVLHTKDRKPRNPRAIDGMKKFAELRTKTMYANVAKLHAAGVPIVLGTDAGNPLTLHGPSIFVELEAMQAAGMDAKAVLTAATSQAAHAMNRAKDLGRVAIGFQADLLVLDQDPEQDTKAYRSLTHVIRGGNVHSRNELLPRGN